MDVGAVGDDGKGSFSRFVAIPSRDESKPQLWTGGSGRRMEQNERTRAHTKIHTGSDTERIESTYQRTPSCRCRNSRQLCQIARSRGSNSSEMAGMYSVKKATLSINQSGEKQKRQQENKA